MRIIFFGTGSVTPTSKKKGKPFRSYSAVLVEVDKETILFDIGPGTLTKMQMHGIATSTVPTTLFLSHYHIDHCLDYIALLKERALRALQGEKPQKLIVYGPKGLLRWHEQLFLIDSWKYMIKELLASRLVELHEIDEKEIVQQGAWKTFSLKVPHDDGLAYRLEVKGKAFVYSGDMGYVSTFADFSKYADVVAIECSFPDKKSVKGTHLCPEDIGTLAKNGMWKHIVLTHLYPVCEGKENNMIAALKRFTKAKVIVGYDFLSLSV